MINGNTSKPGLQKRQYFSSSEGPFHTANNIYLFYGGGERAAMVDGIAGRLLQGAEPVVVLGEAGSGKSMMSLVLADRLAPKYNVIRCEHKQLDSSTLLRQLAIEISPQAAVELAHQQDCFTKEYSGNASSLLLKEAPDVLSTLTDEQLSAELFSAITSSLLQGTSNNKPVLLIVDAQQLNQACYDAIERLTCVENRFGNAFKAIIFQTKSTNRSDDASPGKKGSAKGSPWYSGRPLSLPFSLPGARSEGRQEANDSVLFTDFETPKYLKQQEPLFLRKLNLAEISEYLQHHMLLFDFNKRDLFTRDMAYFIADRSDGVFKSINVLARNAFMLANLEGAQQMSMSHLLMAGLPPREEKKPAWYRRSRDARKIGVALAAIGVVVSMAVVLSLIA